MGTTKKPAPRRDRKKPAAKPAGKPPRKTTKQKIRESGEAAVEAAMEKIQPMTAKQAHGAFYGKGSKHAEQRIYPQAPRPRKKKPETFALPDGQRVEVGADGKYRAALEPMTATEVLRRNAEHGMPSIRDPSPEEVERINRMLTPPTPAAELERRSDEVRARLNTTDGADDPSLREDEPGRFGDIALTVFVVIVLVAVLAGLARSAL